MKITTKELSINNKPIKVHAIPSGKLAIKNAAVATKKPGLFSTIKSFRDKTFTEWMPIWTWVIEHPEGVFLIDTGETSAVNDTNYFKPLGFLMNYYFTKQMKFEISRMEEIDQQLEKIGLSPAQIDKVILTHLHIDHTDGLQYFPNKPILVNQLEWKKPHSVFPKLFPDWFAPTLVDLNQSYEGFEKAAFLTEGKDLILLHTPGHTYGHCSVLLKTDQGLVLFAGDVVYYEEQLIGNQFSATIASAKATLDSCQKIKNLAKKNKVVFLPTHDKDAGHRLEKMISLEGKFLS